MSEYLSRALEMPLREQLNSHQVLILLGARRVGKTVLLQQLGQAFDGPTLFLNGEDLITVDLLTDRRMSAYRSWLGSTRLLLLDEAQAVPEVGRALKLLIDSFPELTILATGSSAFELSNRTGEPLVGRQRVYPLFPLAQLELSAVENGLQTRQNLEDRLIYGSYPDVVRLPSAFERTRYLSDMAGSYLLKDILAYEQVRNSHKMLQLLRLVAYQVGQEVSYDELGKQLGLDRGTVMRYLDLFAKVFVLFRLGGYSGNLRKEIVKSSKWYFLDNGLRNALINNFAPLSQRTDVGQLWENYLVSERLKRNAYRQSGMNVYFWRTYDQQELDWLEEKDGVLNAFEFKWNPARSVKTPTAFAQAYPEATVRVVNREDYLEFVGGDVLNRARQFPGPFDNLQKCSPHF